MERSTGFSPHIVIGILVFLILTCAQCQQNSERGNQKKEFASTPAASQQAPLDTTDLDTSPPIEAKHIDRTTESASKTPEKQVVKKEGSLLMPVGDLFLLRVELKGTLLDTLLEAMPKNLRVCRALASETEEALHFQMDTRKQMSKGDVATLVFKEGGRGVVARLYGVRYFSRILDRELRAYYYWETDKPYPEYFDSDGVSLTPRLKRPPLQQYQRIGRIAGKNPTREGIFFLAQPETGVRAPFNSRVLGISWPPLGQGEGVELS